MTDTLTFTPALPWPTNPSDGAYGRCMTCVFDLTGGMSSGRQAHAEALARMLITDAGSLLPVSPDDAISPVYGYNLLDLVNARIKVSDLSAIAANVITQFRLDDRTLDATAGCSYAGGVLIILSTVTDKNGPFPLTLAVNEVSIAILNQVTTS